MISPLSRKIVFTATPLLFLASGCQGVKNTLPSATPSPTTRPIPTIEKTIESAKAKICAFDNTDLEAKTRLIENSVIPLWQNIKQIQNSKQYAEVIGLIRKAEKKASVDPEASTKLYNELSKPDQQIADNVCKQNGNPRSASSQIPQPGGQ